jgi:3-oxoacyl-[acyl-carrier-protein] synthase-3
MSKVWIKDIAYYVPERVVTNEEIIEAHSLKMKASWIEKRIGITERRWASENQAASDLAIEAAKKLDLQGFEGAIWVSTISQDYYTPSTASIIKGQLGLTDHLPAIDMNNACAGQIFALDNAVARLKTTDEKHALVIATEVRSRFLNMKDRRTVFLFADGAVVFQLEKTDDAPGEVEWCISKTIPSTDFEILVPGGGSRKPFKQFTQEEDFHPFIKMQDGEKIFQATTESLIGLITDSLAKNNLTVEDYDYYVFHQGNGAIISKVCDTLGISSDKTWVNFDHFGNTSSASMGIALAEAQELGKIKKGDRVLVMAMGAGFHVGMASIKWGI